VLIVGMFMSVLDISIINVAIPTMQRDFATTTDGIQWVENAYSLALGVVVPVSAWLAARFGPGRVYNLSLLGFAAGSALCGVAWDLNSMVAFRVLQALPGGVLPVVTLTILYKIVPKDRIGAAMGMYGLGIIVAPAVGPTLGGYLVEYVDWRLIFFINVPVGILGVVAAIFLLPKFGPTPVGRFDVLGFVTVATGLVCLLLALTEGQKWGWTSYTIMILLTVGVLGLALFVVIELEVDAPLLNVRVFQSWAFTNSLLLVSVLSIGLFAVLFYIPLLLQQARGLGAFETGLLLLPQALVMAVIMPAAGLLYDKIGPRWPAVIGLALVALGTYLLTDVNLESSTSHVIWVLVLRAVGMGLHDADHDRRTVGGVAGPGRRGECVQQRRPADVVGAGAGRADVAGDVVARAVRRGPGVAGVIGHFDARAGAGGDGGARRHVRGVHPDPDAGVRRGDARAVHRHRDHHGAGHPAGPDAAVGPQPRVGRGNGGSGALNGAVSVGLACDDPWHGGSAGVAGPA
jgi:EmrB/QacA subfamily drug resistance transporter